MRGAFGKPLGKAARVDIGTILFSIRCNANNVQTAKEALRRSSFKFPGRQTIVVSRKFGFTKFTKPEFYKLQKEGKIVPDGVHVKVITNHGPLSRLAMFK
jgi:large subunit ribosomal protein L10e